MAASNMKRRLNIVRLITLFLSSVAVICLPYITNRIASNFLLDGWLGGWEGGIVATWFGGVLILTAAAAVILLATVILYFCFLEIATPIYLWLFSNNKDGN